eukprot:917376-Prorocentrum_lima.AAC.1
MHVGGDTSLRHLLCLSYNVTTLAMHLPSNAARVAMFADSLHAHHIGVAMVQEGRSKQDGVLTKH